MHLLSLIQRAYDPQDKNASQPNSTVCKFYQMATEGFKYLNLHELNDYDFSVQCLRNWVTHMSPATADNHVDRTLPLPEIIIT